MDIGTLKQMKQVLMDRKRGLIMSFVDLTQHFNAESLVNESLLARAIESFFEL